MINAPTELTICPKPDGFHVKAGGGPFVGDRPTLATFAERAHADLFVRAAFAAAARHRARLPTATEAERREHQAAPLLTASDDELATLEEHSGHDWSADERAGARLFHAGAPFSVAELYGSDGEHGWHVAHRRCYALGVLDAAADRDGRYPQFSAAWEAWGDGWNDAGIIERRAAEPIED